MQKELTKMDINAIKKSDDLIFRCNGSGKTRIEAVKRVGYKEKEKNPFADDRYHFIDDVKTEIEEGRIAFEMLHSHQYCPMTKTIVNLLRPGDILVVIWNENGYGNGLTEKAGLVVDSLMLRVFRKEKLKYTFMVAQCICEDNTARMIRRA